MSLAGEERKNYILEQLQQHGRVSSLKLATVLSVSTESIRTYLSELEQANKLRRVYGGAVSLAAEPDFQTRQVTNLDSKEKIGRIAASLVNNGDVIALDEGTTTIKMIKHLCHLTNLTIVTGSLSVMEALSTLGANSEYAGEAIFIGGRVNFQNLRVTGSMAEEQFRSYNFSKAFIAADGINAKGLFCYEQDKGFLSRVIMAQSVCNIVLCDHTKIGKTRFFNLAELKGIDYVVSDIDAPVQMGPALCRARLQWITATEQGPILNHFAAKTKTGRLPER